jgi:hypothetical protein
MTISNPKTIESKNLGFDTISMNKIKLRKLRKLKIKHEE